MNDNIFKGVELTTKCKCAFDSNVVVGLTHPNSDNRNIVYVYHKWTDKKMDLTCNNKHDAEQIFALLVYGSGEESKKWWSLFTREEINMWESIKSEFYQ